jgi:hypothetical protein
MRLFVALVFALGVGCGKDEQEPPTPAARPQDVVPAVPPKKLTEPGVPTMSEPAPKKPSVTDLGVCSIKATGALTVEESTPGGRAAVASKYWQSAEERSASPVQDLTINCLGKDVRFSVVSKPGAAVPFGPKTYRLEKGRGDLVVLARAGKPLSNVTGTVDVTAFDGRHIAGTINVTGKQQGGGNVTLDGSFDFACPGYGGCARN